MTIETLQAEMYSAMKAKDKFRKDVISSLLGAVKKVGIDNGCRDNIPADMVDAALLKEQKTMQEMIDTCPASRPETLEEYKNKKKIIDEFAPQLMTDPAAIRIMIENILTENNIEPIKKNRGTIMKTIMPQFKGKADMGVVNKVVGEIIQ